MSFQRNKKPLEELLYYTTKPHPLRGEKPMLAVRSAAKEAIDAVFNSTGRPVKLTGARMQGFGGGSSMQGFGSGGSGSMGSGGMGGGSGGTWSSEASTFASTPTHAMAGGAPHGSHQGSGAAARPEYSGTYSAGTRMGADGNPLPLSSGAYSTGTMQGFGNPAFQNKTSSEGYLSKASEAVKSSLRGLTGDQATGGFNPQRYQGNGSYNPSMGSGSGNGPPTPVKAFDAPEAAYASNKTCRCHWA